MNTQLLANLEKCIEQFIDKNCENDKWPHVWQTDNTVKHMAKAAACVFDNAVEQLEFERQQNS